MIRNVQLMCFLITASIVSGSTGSIAKGLEFSWQSVSVSVTSAVNYKEYYPEKSTIRCVKKATKMKSTVACYKDQMCRLIADDINTIIAPSTEGWNCKTTGMVAL